MTSQTNIVDTLFMIHIIYLKRLTVKIDKFMTHHFYTENRRFFFPRCGLVDSIQKSNSYKLIVHIENPCNIKYLQAILNLKKLFINV